jgi:ATP-dependent helicase HrpA
MAADLAALVTSDVLKKTPFERVKHLPRYLKAMQVRADRWKRDQAKDTQRAGEIAPFAAALKKLGSAAGEFRWLVEEFRVSLFAQELGTAEPVSVVRLTRALQELGVGGAAAKAAVPVPAKLAIPLPVKGKTVFKSFDGLGNLPR